MSKAEHQRSEPKNVRKEERQLDDAIEDSFPASDPVAPAVPVTKPKIDPRSLKEKAKEHELPKQGSENQSR